MNVLSIFNKTNDKFYLWFEQAAENNYQAAKFLEALCKNFRDPKETAKKVHLLEHKGDEISHNIYNQLNKAFTTPLDREDIIALTSDLDDVMDLIHASTTALDIYNVKKVTPIAQNLARVITDCTRQIAKVLPKLRHRRDFHQVHKASIEINRLENEADDLLRQGLRELFYKSRNPIDVLRWRDIYRLMEEATDKSEDIAQILEGLITKYA